MTQSKNILVSFLSVAAFLVAMSSLSSCEKITQDETTAKVSIYNAFTGEPVNDLEILVYQAKYATASETNPKKSFLIASGKTSTDGKYDFGKFLMKKAGNWSCVMAFTSDPDNYRLYYGLEDTILTKAANNDLVLYTYPLAAGIRLNITPPPPFDFGDSLIVTFKHSSGDTFQITDRNILFGQIGYNDVFMGNYTVTVKKVKNGATTIFNDTFFINVNEQLEFNVQF